MQALSCLFDLLDSDKDGRIDSKNVNVQKMDTRALEILSVLLIEMEQGNHMLTRDEFIESCLRLLKTLSVEERHRLVFGFRQKSVSENREFTFHV